MATRSASTPVTTVNLDKLRSLVRSAGEKGASSTAVFLATKLCTLSNYAPRDALLLAHAFKKTSQISRCLLLLESNGLLHAPSSEESEDEDGDRRAWAHFLDASLLASRCWLSQGKVEEAQSVLANAVGGVEDWPPPVSASRGLSTPLERLPEEAAALVEVCERLRRLDALAGWEPGELSTCSLLCTERGKAFAMQDDRVRSMFWTRCALLVDAACVEALDALVGGQLTPMDESRLLDQLSAVGGFEHSERAWLKPVLTAMMSRYATHVSCEERFLPLRDVRATTTGPSLASDVDLLSVLAESKFHTYDVRGVHEITSKLFLQDPNNTRAALTHVSALVELGLIGELFYFAHAQIKESPHRAESWYAAGAYYFAQHKYESARRFMHKATMMDPSILAAWIGIGHAYAMHDETDRAMAAYRTAARLFPGSHAPEIGTAMEYARTNNVALAELFSRRALALCDADPIVYNELGTVHFRMGRFEEASACFREAMKRGTAEDSEASDTFCMNLAHSLRKAGALEEAVQAYEHALTRNPKCASAHAALGLALHGMGDLVGAVDRYHVSLSLRPADLITTELLTLAFSELYETSDLSLKVRNMKRALEGTRR